MKPIIFYVDDDARNLAVFESSLSDEWDVRTFENPMKALEAMNQITPTIIVSDQRMPGTSGVQYLELAQKISPDSVRIIVTGYSDEDLVVESVRKAHIFDYLRKPWDADELESSLKRAKEFFDVNLERKNLILRLQQRDRELSERNEALQRAAQELEQTRARENEVRKELESWVHPFVLCALQEKDFKFPVKRDLVGVTFDIVGSSKLHGKHIGGRPVRSLIIQTFSEIIIKHGGWRENHSGDSAYGHFGLFKDTVNPSEAAMSVAREFRVALRSLSEVHQVEVECGIAIHLAHNCLVDVHTAQINTPKGMVVQKSFDTTSNEVDLLHRMEKLVHQLPGTNIILTGEFIQSLKTPPAGVVEIGQYHFAGATEPTQLYLIKSDRVSDEMLNEFKLQFQKSAGDSGSCEDIHSAA